LKIDQIYFSTFFGGNEHWATSKAETVYFDDFKVSIPTPPKPAFRKVPQHYGSIQEAIDASNPGDTVAVRGHHTTNVIVDKPIYLKGYSGTSIRAADPGQPAITITSDNVRVRRFKIKRGGLAVENGHPFVRLEQVDVHDAMVGIDIGSGCDHAEIFRCDVWDNEQDGIRIVGSKDVLVEESDACDNGGAGFRFQQTDNLTVNRCDARWNDDAGFAVSGNDGYLVGNRARGNGGSGFSIASDRHWIFDNQARRNQLAGFEFQNVRQANVSSNRARSNEGDGFAIIFSSSNVFSDNRSRRNDGDGFVLDEQSDSNVRSSNDAEDNGGFGFHDLGTQNTFSDNSCDDNDAGGSNPPGLCDE